MRLVVAGLLFVAALMAIAASMGMNWTFWTAQGVDQDTSRVLGAVSVMVDIFKATLPLVIAWAWVERMRVGAAIASVLFCGCLIFSIISAIGFASWLRGTVTESRESVSRRYTVASGELGETDQGIVGLAARPMAVVQALIERAKQDRRWTSTDGCKAARSESSRSYCVGVGDLSIELAAAEEREKLQMRRTALRSEIAGLIGSGARLDSDLQAGILSRIFGVRLTRVQNVLVVLVAVIVELSAGFGLYLASLPLHGVGYQTRSLWARRQTKADLTNRFAEMKRLSKPTRLVRKDDGQLMIE